MQFPHCFEFDVKQSRVACSMFQWKMAHHLLADRFGMSFINKCWINHTFIRSDEKYLTDAPARPNDERGKMPIALGDEILFFLVVRIWISHRISSHRIALLQLNWWFGKNIVAVALIFNWPIGHRHSDWLKWRNEKWINRLWSEIDLLIFLAIMNNNTRCVRDQFYVAQLFNMPPFSKYHGNEKRRRKKKKAVSSLLLFSFIHLFSLAYNSVD